MSDDAPATFPTLALEGVTRRFGAVVALDDVDFTLRPGTVHALLGENGAGKSTLMRVAYGMLAPDAGAVVVQGVPRRFASPADAIAAGIGMVHQHFTLVPAMTVAENLALGGRGPYSARAARRRVADVSAATGFALDPDARAGGLSVGAQQRVEIAKALARDARVLVLDEPTGVLAPAEVDDLLRWLRAYVERGNAAVLITHKLREALAVADDVTVLRRGARVFHGPVRDASERALTAAMLGADAAPGRAVAGRAAVPGDVVIAARGLDVADAAGAVRIRGASFAVRAGELVGVAAVEGSGQRELLRALAGRLPAAAGSLVVPGDAGFVPEDRHHDAVLLGRSLVENVALRGAGRARGRMAWAGWRSWTRALVEAFDVRAAGVDVAMRALSGGNQQKLVLARELSARPSAPNEENAPRDPATRHPSAATIGGTAPSLVVVENPTRGLDVRATAAVHERLRQAAARGAAVVVYSSDLDEVLALAGRVLVVHQGTVHDMGADRDAIGRAMLGVSA